MKLPNVNPFFIPRAVTLSAAEFFRISFEDWLSTPEKDSLFRGHARVLRTKYSLYGDAIQGECP